MRLTWGLLCGYALCMKPIRPEVVALQSRIFSAQLKLGEVLTSAGLKQSTWWRWVHGAEPKLSSLEAVSAAIETKLAERQP